MELIQTISLVVIAVINVFFALITIGRLWVSNLK
jgi:hypothetical protein